MLVDPATVFITHVSEAAQAPVGAIVDADGNGQLAATRASTAAGAGGGVDPDHLSVSDVQKVLQNLLREKVSIRNLEVILESLIDMGRNNKDLGYLSEIVRQKLARRFARACWATCPR